MSVTASMHDRQAGVRHGHTPPSGEPGLPRLLPPPGQHAPAAGQPPRIDLSAHLRRHGLLRFRGPALTEQVAAAGLTGRGGAAFPVATKLAAVARRGTKTIVAGNGAEGEPASSKDAALLWYAPHLVLDGLQAAAEVIGAQSAYLYVHERRGYPQLNEHVQAALASRASAGTDRAHVELMVAPPRFLAGEETALVARLNGAAARPRDKSHRVFDRGIGGRPTLVQNVETLAQLALVARHGGDWFRTVGTVSEPGSMLCTLRGPDGVARVVEAALGTPLARLLPLGDDVQAVLAGGYHGGWLSAADARSLTLSNADLRPAGTMVGAGVLVALPAGCCGLAETANVARFLAMESAGQCGPCRNGLPAIAGALGTIAQPGRAERELADVRRWASLVTGRGACHHPDGTVRFVASALSVFAGEIAEHARGRCTATWLGPFLPLAEPPQTEADWR